MIQSEYESIVRECAKWYPKRKREHCIQVETYVIEDPMFFILSEDQQWFVRALAYAHDVIEDTDCPIDALLQYIGCSPESYERLDFETDLFLLTHTKDIAYYDYVKTLVESRRMLAIMVKRADMKDHLTRKKTLTPKLKAKYEPVLPMLFYPHGVLR